MGLICNRTTQCDYFDEQLGRPNWKGNRILDFGGNVGGFLHGSDDRVNHQDYWCLDLNETALAQGRKTFPKANFVHYNHYSSEYNPNGIPGLPLPDIGTFDMIFAFSVFTHTDTVQMLNLIQQLEAKLASGGVLAFTFCDHTYDKALTDPTVPPGTDLKKMLEETRSQFPHIDVAHEEARAKGARWCLLIDDTLHIEPDESVSQLARKGKAYESYCSYFTAEYMQELLPEARVLPPVSPEWQHCAVIEP